MRKDILVGRKSHPHWGPRIRRKSDREPKHGHGKSVNKYAHLAPKRDNGYDPRDKTFRDLPVMGKRNETVRAGLRTIFHGRLYELQDDVTIPAGAPLVIGRSDMWEGIGKFRLVAYIDRK